MLVHHSGGFIYHLRALRYFSREWLGHREAVARFLSAWNPQSEHLVLIGPSGGYSLPSAFLKQFKSITAFEPDSLARVIFEKRTGVRPDWVKREFTWNQKDFESVVHPHSAFLFCNLLGQIEMKKSGPMSTFFKSFSKGQEWASYHDAFSGTCIRFHLPKRNGKISPSEVKSTIEATGVVEMTQHLAFDVFTDSKLQYEYWEWRLTPRSSHLIEGVFHVRTD